MATAKKKKVLSTTPTKKQAPKGGGGGSAAIWEQYVREPDADSLRVYADALEQEGDPRGAFLQLCLAGTELTEEQEAAKAKMLSKSKKAMAGPGAAHLREFDIGGNGLVSQARTEIDKVIAHVDEIAALNPRLVLTITSLKTQKDAQAVAKVSLAPIYFVDFGWITGTHGGMAIEDKIFDIIAPSLAGVRHLQLSCRGDKRFTPDTLKKAGEHLNDVRYLAFDFYAPNAKPADYAHAIASSPGFKSLKVLDFPEVTAKDLSGRKLLKLNPGLLESGRFSDKTDKALEKPGTSFIDMLEKTLS